MKKTAQEVLQEIKGRYSLSDKGAIELIQESIKQTIDENITTNKRLPGYGSWLQFICRLSTAPEKGHENESFNLVY